MEGAQTGKETLSAPHLPAEPLTLPLYCKDCGSSIIAYVHSGKQIIPNANTTEHCTMFISILLFFTVSFLYHG